MSVDCEGWVDGNDQDRVRFIMDSTGAHIEREDGLSTVEALEFLLDLPRRAGGPCRVVSFGFGWDTDTILADLPRSRWIRLNQKSMTLWRDYRIRRFPDRMLEIRDLRNGRLVRIEDLRLLCGTGVPFVRACEEWGSKVPDFVREGKAKRARFTWTDVTDGTIPRYTAGELSLMVELAKAMKHAADEAGLQPRHLYSPAQLSTALLNREGMRSRFKARLPRKLEADSWDAYFGGRIEDIQYGVYHGTVFEWDVNSAYPSALAALPDLSRGAWTHRNLEKEGATMEDLMRDLPFGEVRLVRLRFKFPSDSRFHPLPFRGENGRVYFPMAGTGLYWWPEVKAAWDAFRANGWGHREGEHCQMTPMECWDFLPEDKPRVWLSWRGEPKNRLVDAPEPANRYPFKWVRRAYEQRKIWEAEGRVGAARMLKLALNALYGKFAQQTSMNRTKPYYTNPVLAGLLTSHTRARLYAVAAACPDDVIAFATDAVFLSHVTEFGRLEGPLLSPGLGRFKRTEFTGGTFVQSGFYELTRADGEPTVARRGFGERNVPFDLIREGWAKNRMEIRYTMKAPRFVSTRSALARNRPGIARTWETKERRVSLIPTGKRKDASGTYHPEKRWTAEDNPSLRLFQTVPDDLGFAPTSISAHRIPEYDREPAVEEWDEAMESHEDSGEPASTLTS